MFLEPVSELAHGFQKHSLQSPKEITNYLLHILPETFIRLQEHIFILFDIIFDGFYPFESKLVHLFSGFVPKEEANSTKWQGKISMLTGVLAKFPKICPIFYPFVPIFRKSVRFSENWNNLREDCPNLQEDCLDFRKISSILGKIRQIFGKLEQKVGKMDQKVRTLQNKVWSFENNQYTFINKN